MSIRDRRKRTCKISISSLSGWFHELLFGGVGRGQGVFNGGTDRWLLGKKFNFLFFSHDLKILDEKKSNEVDVSVYVGRGKRVLDIGRLAQCCLTAKGTWATQ